MIAVKRNNAVSARRVGVTVSLLALWAVFLLAGCGTGGKAPTPGAGSTSSASTQPSTPVTSSTVPTATSESGAGPTPAQTPASVMGVFSQAAQQVAPLPFFAPTELPDGAVLTSTWLPVLEAEEPQVGGSDDRANPYILGEGADSEVQVVLRVGDGWLLIVENFHGDLGDVTGEDVGSVDGHAARLYGVNGGELVQWSVEGMWYGVYGRGLDRDAIVRVALNMVQVTAESL